MERTPNPESDVEKARLDELANKSDRTEEETKEFEKLRLDLDKKNTQKRIDELTWKSKSAEEKWQEEQRQREKLEQELQELRNKPAEPVNTTRETIEAGGKKHYTDRTLKIMVDSGELTSDEAFTLQQQRIEDVAADKAYRRIKEDQEKETKMTKVQAEARAILSERPDFDKNHPNFNVNDPVYKETMGFINDGLSPMKAYETAKKLHPKAFNVDNTHNLNAYSPGAPSSTPAKKEEPISEEMGDLVYRMYRDETNPKTNRLYTRAEAIEKHRQASETRRKVNV